MEMLFISRQGRHFDFDVLIYKILFPICTLIWQVDNYVSRQERSNNRKNEIVQLKRRFLSICSPDDNTHYCYFHTL